MKCRAHRRYRRPAQRFAQADVATALAMLKAHNAFVDECRRSGVPNGRAFDVVPSIRAVS
jgi:hypothetical protein